METFKIIFTSKAQSDLAECISFVLKVSKEAAYALANDIYSSVQTLEMFPERNAIFEMPKSFPFTVRKLVINKRYLALYTIENDTVIIYRFIDSRRKFDYLI